MQVPFLEFTLIFAVADWLAVEFSWQRVNMICKPGTMLFLIAWFSQEVGWREVGLIFGMGLVFSLLGDVLLLFPERFFMPGLVSFLLAHTAYILGFNLTSLPLSPLLPIFLACILGIDLWVFRKLVSTSAGRRMAVLIIFYMAAISLMLLSALSCLARPEWSLRGALAVGLGAFLFFLSDFVLAYNRFVARTWHNDLVVMSSYHLAQIGIVLGLTWK